MTRTPFKSLLAALTLAPLVAMAEPQTFQSTNMVDLTQQPVAAAEGAAFLTRSANRLRAQVMLADLIPGHAYTVWWLVFNDPGRCATKPCAPGPDFGPGNASVYFGTGGIASAGGGVGGGAGVLNVSFETSAGGPPTGAFVADGPAPGLVPGHGFAAEVHLLMIDHGVPDADMANAPGTWAWELSHPLPPGQADVRAALFFPVAP